MKKEQEIEVGKKGLHECEREKELKNRGGFIWFQWNVCWHWFVARGLRINDWTVRLSKPEDFCRLLWACAVRWRESSSQLIDTELTMKHTKHSPSSMTSAPWKAKEDSMLLKRLKFLYTHPTSIHPPTHPSWDRAVKILTCCMEEWAGEYMLLINQITQRSPHPVPLCPKTPPPTTTTISAHPADTFTRMILVKASAL